MPLIPIAMSLLSSFAPGMVKSLAGPKAGAIAESVVGIAKQLTGEADVENLPAALKAASPEIQLQFSQNATQEIIALAQIDLQNTQGARARDVDMRKLGMHNWRADIMVLAASVLLAYIIYIIGTQVGLSQTAVALLSSIAGWLGKMLSDAFNFEFGSSRSSREKTILMGEKK